MIVFDSSAIIAFFQSEKGNDVVDMYLQQETTIISSVNFAEILLKLKQFRLDANKILDELYRMKLAIVDCDQIIALAATEITHPKNIFLSLGDRICLATAISKKCPVLTAGSNWKKLKLPVEVIAIR